MSLTLAKVYRDLLSFQLDHSKIPRDDTRPVASPLIERNPSPEFKVLLAKDNVVVPLLDYLYYSLYRVDTPKVVAFKEPLHGTCYYRGMAHVGAELDRIGALYGTTPDYLFSVAREMLEADISASGEDFTKIFEECQTLFTGSALTGSTESAAELNLKIHGAQWAASDKVKEIDKKIAELTKELTMTKARQTTLQDLENKTMLLASVQHLANKRRRTA